MPGFPDAEAVVYAEAVDSGPVGWHWGCLVLSMCGGGILTYRARFAGRPADVLTAVANVRLIPWAIGALQRHQRG